MKLTDFFVSEKQTADTVKVKVPVDAAKNSMIQRQIHSLVPGQTLYGEVLSKSGNEVQIRISEDFILQARLDQQMNLDIGKILTFEVKNTGKSLMLSPLFTNVSTDANVLKALDMASLPVNESTVAMTQKLMEAGLPIDKNSLQQVFREINQFTDAEIPDIVNLHKLQMTVNDKNVAQMVSYRNLTHQLVAGLNNVLEAVPELMNSMIETGNQQGAMKLYQQLVSMIQEIPAGEEKAVVPTEQIQTMATPETSVVQQLPNGADVLREDVEQVVKPDAAISVDTPEDTASIGITKEGETKPESVLPGKENVTEVLLVDKEIPNKEEVSKAFKPLLQFLKEQWTITPEEVADPENMDKLYNRLNRQLKGLAQALEGMGERNSTAFRAINNLSQNLDFMQQINQAYTYVQIPLRLQQGEAHGELFVYTNKKHLATKDGQISALLHLDMEHLGPVDVYVSMVQEKVNTKFYLRDDDMLDFIMGHMDILTERLKKRGYQCNCEMLVREQEGQTNSIHKLLQTETHVPLAEYAFDVRT